MMPPDAVGMFAAWPAHSRDGIFAYTCRACGRCCHGKRIPVGPYDVVRMARHLGLSTGAFMRHHLHERGPWLASPADGACVFLDDGRCTLHADRPLACRTWPLARHTTPDGTERFVEMPGQAGSRGSRSDDGRVSDYLAQQGALPYLDACTRYLRLYQRLHRRLHAVLPGRPGLVHAAPAAMPLRRSAAGLCRYMRWLDVDAAAGTAVALRSAQRTRPCPPEAAMTRHIHAIDAWFGEIPGPAGMPAAVPDADEDLLLELAIATLTLGLSLGIGADQVFQPAAAAGTKAVASSG